MPITREFWSDRSVLVTGHTGFKGSWLSLWLNLLGARVHGYALDPTSPESLYDAGRIASAIANDTRADLANLQTLNDAFLASMPSVVFHLAAQPLVRESYREPVNTFATNVMGTVHVLDTVRKIASVHVVVIVTTDKVYAQRRLAEPYREEDALGGQDPYSASKSAVELVTESYRSSFFHNESRVRIATARAGNVIGGGDWATDRLIPDCVRAFVQKRDVSLRYPHAVRPWQHVLEPSSGYLQLAERLAAGDGIRHARAWNFGPDGGNDATVSEVAHIAAALWGGGVKVLHEPSPSNPHEAEQLRLDSTRARQDLDWKPCWSFREGLERTIEWYRAWADGCDMSVVTRRQIADYHRIAPT